MNRRLWIALFAAAWVGVDPFSAIADESEPLAFTYFERCIFLKMRIGDHRDLMFLLDTGASASAVDSKTAGRLGLKTLGATKVEGTAGVIDAATVLVPDLSAGKASVADLRATAHDLGGSLAPKGTRLDGILGYDFLAKFAVKIDYDRRIIGFSPKPIRADLKTTVAVPFTLDNGIPRLKAVLNGIVETDLRLDTGASLFETKDVYLNVTEAAWKKLTAADPKLVPKRYFKGAGPGGEVKLPVARIERFTLGGVAVARPYVIVQPKAGYFARPDAVGFVSNNLLDKHSPVAIDYLDRKLYLTKNGKPR